MVEPSPLPMPADSPPDDSSGRPCRRVGRLLQGVLLRTRWIWVALAVSAMGWPFFAERRAHIAGDHRIGPVDGSAYALQARSLAAGRGLRIPYVINFYHRYAPEISRRDDQWPPGPAFILAPVFRRHGPDAARGREAMLFVATILFPLAGAWLAGEATRRTWPALVAAGMLLSSTLIARQGAAILGDVPVAAVFAAYLAALLASRRHRAWLVAAGLLGGLAYYMKGSQVILLPLLPGLAVVRHGFRVLRSPWLAGGVAAYLAVVGPWWIANAREYGHPLHSTQNYVTVFFGLTPGTWDGWDPNFYGVHFGHGLPRRTARFEDREVWMGSVRRNLEAYARALLMGPDAAPRDWARMGAAGPRVRAWILDREPPVQPPPDGDGEAPAVFSGAEDWPAWPFTVVQGMGLLVGLVALLGMVPVLMIESVPRLRPSSSALRSLGRWGTDRVRVAAVLALALLAQALFIILMWLAMDRFVLLVVAPVIALGLLGLDLIPDFIRGSLARLGWLRRRMDAGWRFALVRTVTTLAVCGLGLWVWAGPSASIRAAQAPARPRAPDAPPVYPGPAHTARALEPVLPANAVIMARYPLGVLFFGPDTWKGVGLPFAEPPVLFSIARYYGVTHLLRDLDRPGLAQFIREHPEALERIPIPGHRRLNIYRIHYDRFPEGFFLDPDEIGTERGT